MKLFFTNFAEYLKKIFDVYSSSLPSSLEKQGQDLLRSLEKTTNQIKVIIKKPINYAFSNDNKHQAVLWTEIRDMSIQLEELSNILLDISLNVANPPVRAAANDPEKHWQLRIFKKFNFAIFHMEQCHDRIVIVEGGCVKIFNASLEIIRTSYVFNAFCVDKIIKNFDETAVLLIDSYHKLFIYMTLHDGSYSLIHAPQLENNELSPLYWWETDEVIISLVNGQLLAVDVNTCVISEINMSYKVKRYHNFYAFYQHARNYEHIVWADAHNYLFTFLDRQTMMGGLVNWLTKEEKVFYHLDYDIFTCYYAEPYLFLIGTEIVQYTDGISPITTVLRSSGSYRITGLRVINQMPPLFIVSCQGHNVLAAVGALVLYSSNS